MVWEIDSQGEEPGDEEKDWQSETRRVKNFRLYDWLKGA